MDKKILLVDIDSEVNEINKKALECNGFQVTCAENAEEALDILNSSKPDAIVTEIMLENNDSGFGLAYCAKGKYPDIPVVILSDIVRKTGILFEINSDEERNWIKADEFINKPISPAKLALKIQRLLS
jgi:CheY-like chemotaxis protein